MADKKKVTQTGVEFSTGAVRSGDAEKTRYDLISPIGLRRIAETCHEGAEKYGDYNWERGMPIGDLLNHAIRHVYLYLSGDRKEDHLAHAGWNVMAAMHSEELWPDLNRQLRTAACGLPDAEMVSHITEEDNEESDGRAAGCHLDLHESGCCGDNCPWCLDDEFDVGGEG